MSLQHRAASTASITTSTSPAGTPPIVSAALADTILIASAAPTGRRSTVRALLVGVLASVSFGTSGGLMKPLLEHGWSPTAAVAMRTLIAGLVLAPFAVYALRGKWRTLWAGRWRVVGMAVIGVAGTQLTYFVAIARIPVGSAILVEYLAPVLLVMFAWVTSRRMPKPVVLIGTVAALAGLVLVVGPSSLAGLGAGPGGASQLIGVAFAFLAAIGAAAYYLIAARPSVGLPPVALAATGLLLGSLALGVLGVTGALPFTANFGEVPMGGGTAPWWVPLGIVALVGTAVAYASSIAATAWLGSRIMSFVGLLEVVFAGLFAWLLLGEALTPVQLLGGALILVGIGFVHSERTAADPAPIELVEVFEPGENLAAAPSPAPTP